MKRLFLLLALLAALFAGWVPVMAGSLHAAATASHHGGHVAHADQAASDDHADHGGKRNATAHPLLCSACFALPAEAGHGAPPPTRFMAATHYVVTLVGGEVLPPVPPPRTRSF